MDSEGIVAEQEQDAQLIEATDVAESENEPEIAATDLAVAESEKDTDTNARPSDIEALKPGMRVKGKVRNVVDFGAFIDIGVGRDGLAHISTLQRAGIDKTVKVGDVLDVQIRRIDVENNRISLTIPGAGKGTKTSLRDLEVNSTVSGRVVRVVDFGAFIDVGAQTDGLLHISQMAWGYVSHPSEVLKVGDEVEVRILEVDAQKRRISLTMKQGGEEVIEEPTPSASASSDENMPTAFQVAWEKAMAQQQHGQHKSRS